jgi:hypothetical protein
MLFNDKLSVSGEMDLVIITAVIALLVFLALPTIRDLSEMLRNRPTQR